jgi:hypothetical protein
MGCTVCKVLEKKTYPPLPLKQFTPLAQIKQTLHTQPGVTYAQITKQNSYAATNKPTSSANHQYTMLKKCDEKPF